jgi:asparagine synthase (glutamine-hydrolysing)
MCGIAGIWTERGAPQISDALAAMTDSLSHRGPDGHGFWVDPEAGIGLGHRRLAIVDLSPAGAQPMTSAGGRFVISFNGEIYNHRALRKEIEAAGKAPAWRGGSDTETLLAAIEAWGLARALERCVGMFAIGLWDRGERTLSLARDRFGEKPLYYGWFGDGAGAAFGFGSELKALTAHPAFANPIDPAGTELFLRYAYVPAPGTIYRNVFKAPPGAIVTINAAGRAQRAPKIDAYWRLADTIAAGQSNPYTSIEEAEVAIEAALKEAVSIQLEADVPVGLFLSGGIDSSLIVALAQQASSRRVRTFTIGFDVGGFDESPFAAAVSTHLGTDHTTVRVDARETMAVIPNLATMYDEPFADSSQIPTHIVSRIARQHVTVALSGDGGDELFGGYSRYTWAPALWARFGAAPAPLRRALGAGMGGAPHAFAAIAGAFGLGRGVTQLGAKTEKFAQVLRTAESLDDVYLSLICAWPRGEEPVKARAAHAAAVETTGAAHLADPAERMMYLDALSYLPDDILVKVDRAAMACSLETRAPLLDHRVAAAAWRAPGGMKIQGGVGKALLRKILARHVPAALMERPKAGFAIPIGAWLRGPLRDWAEELLSASSLRDAGLAPDAVTAIWRAHQAGRGDWTARLWTVLMLQSWLETWRDRGRDTTTARLRPLAAVTDAQP